MACIEYFKLGGHLDEKNHEVEKLSNELREVKNAAASNASRLEQVERIQRFETLIIEGFKLDPAKSLKSNVIDNMKLHLDIKMYHSDIKRVKRFGPPGDDGLPKNLSVTFYNPQMKEDLMRLKGRLRPGPVFFCEHLTQHQNDILIEAK